MPRTKRKSKAKRRRTKAEMGELRNALAKIALEYAPATCRQIFYLAVSNGLVEKTQSEYKNVICRLLAEARLNGSLSWDAIVDHTRSGSFLRTTSSLENSIKDIAKFYRRAKWNESPYRVEIWCEKETLKGPLWDEAGEYDVPVFPCKGYPSLSFLHDCAETITSWNRPTYIYYFGDYDATGIDIQRNVQERLYEFTNGEIDIHFKRLAVTQEQIKEMGLPTRPSKTTDTRSKQFHDDAVEVEAIPPDKLRELCRESIESHIDWDQWKTLVEAEKSERSFLSALSKGSFNNAFRSKDEDGTTGIFIPNENGA